MEDPPKEPQDDSGDWPSAGEPPPTTEVQDSSSKETAEETIDGAPAVLSLREVLRAGPLVAAHKVKGSLLGPYVVEAEIGRGGMGAVFRAHHPGLERKVALKVLLAGIGAGPRQRKRFLREATVGAILLHPGIVRVHDYGEEDGFPYIAMELVEGTTLHRKLSRLSRPELIELLIKVGDALGHAHQNGVVHRDLKPANILIRPDGAPVVTDFGLARDLSASSGVTKDGATLGTPVFMAPEQTRGEKPQPATDVFSLGILLYRGLTGQLPFDGETLSDLYEAINTRDPASPSALDPSIPAALSKVCLRALAKDPRQRYPNGIAFARALRSYRKGPIPRPPLLPHLIAVALLLLGAGLFTAALLDDPARGPDDAGLPRKAPGLALGALEDPLPLARGLTYRDGLVRREDWVLAQGLAVGRLRARDAELDGQGYRLAQLSVNQWPSEPRFFAVWQRGQGKSFLGLTAREHHDATRPLGPSHRLTAFATWGRPPTTRYGSGWIPREPGVSWRPHTDLELRELQRRAREARQAGLRPLALAVTQGAERRYSGVWLKDGLEGELALELTRAELSRWLTRASEKGQRPLQVFGYGTRSKARHAVVTVADDTPTATFVHLPPDQHEHALETLSSAGFRPVMTSEDGAQPSKRTLSSSWAQSGTRIWRVRGPEVTALAAVEEQVRNYMKRAGVSQGALAVTRGERLVLARAYTWAPAERPATNPRSRFRLGSVSKTLTAVAALRLVEDGRLDLQASIGDLFPELMQQGVRDSWDSRLLKVTVEQLLQHRGGWDRHLALGRKREELDYWVWDPTIPGSERQVLAAVGGRLPLDPARVMDYMNREPLEFDPGARFAYGNYGYLLLGLIIERTSGRTYEAFLTRDVLARLGPNTLRIGGSRLFERDRGEVLHEDRRLETDAFGGGTVVPLPYALNLECMAAHDGWIGSVVDVARLLAALDPSRDGPLLRGKTVEAMWTPQADAAYGLGWSVNEGRAGHSVGWIPGAWGHMERLPDGTGWVLLFNQQAPDPDLPEQLREALGDLETWPEHDLFD